MEQITIANALSNLGLSKPEASVYLALLEGGARPAGIVAKRSGLKRGHCYNVLTELIGKGIVQEFTKSNVKHFLCSAPQSLVSVIERRESELAQQKEEVLSILSELEKIRNPAVNHPKVRFFEGPEGIKEVFEDALREPTETVCSIADLEMRYGAGQADLFRWFDSFAVRRAEKGIAYRLITNRSTMADRAFDLRKSLKREMKFMDCASIPADIRIYGSKVALVSTERGLVGVLVEDHGIATALRMVFDTLWSVLPNYSVKKGKNQDSGEEAR